MANTTTTTYASTIQTLWRKKLLALMEPRLVLHRWAMTEGVPSGHNTIRSNRVLRLPKITTAKTPGTLVAMGDGTAKALTSNYLDFTLEIWEGATEINEDVDITSFVGSSKNREMLADQAARSHEYQLMKKLCSQGMWWRIDGDATYQQFGAVTSAASTYIRNTGALAEADNFWIGAQVAIYNPNGPGYDEAHTATDSDQSDTEITVAFTNTPSTDSRYAVSSKTGTLATDVLTTSALADVAMWHEHVHTPRFEGGFLRGVMASQQHRDLHKDSDWKAYVQYDRSGVVQNYRPLRWFDIQLLVADEVYRTDADNTENQDDGAVFSCPIFGKDSYAAFKYGHDSGMFSMEWYPIEKPDSYNMTMSRKALAWKSKWAGGVLRATNCLILNTGATAYGFQTFA